MFGVDRSTFNRWVKAGAVPVAVELVGRTGARLFDAAEIADRASAYRAERGSVKQATA